MIFNGVLAAVKAVIINMRPGTSWVAMHRIATKTQIEHLIAGGILKGDLDEVTASGT